MNAEDLIEQVVDTVGNPNYQDADVILKILNRGQRKLANDLFLPDLKNGFDTVTALIDANSVALPSDYHKGLYLAESASGTDLNIYRDVQSYYLVAGHLSLEEGDINSVIPKAGQLIYQCVPTAEEEITLLYYRKPVDLTDSALSYPDGANGEDDFDTALISYACYTIFNIIEDGREGAKVNTVNHKALFKEAVTELGEFCSLAGISYPKRPASNTPWLGTN